MKPEKISLGLLDNWKDVFYCLGGGLMCLVWFFVVILLLMSIGSENSLPCTYTSIQGSIFLFNPQTPDSREIPRPLPSQSPGSFRQLVPPIYSVSISDNECPVQYGVLIDRGLV